MSFSSTSATCAEPRPRGVFDSAVPEGRAVELPKRGTTFVRELSGPPGAPTLVLLHGLGATSAVNWFAVFRPLAERYRVIAVDHRGHGRGLRSRRRFRLADCADDTAALADVLGLERFVAVGYSMGGPIAQLLWHRHRRRVAGLVLCATARNFRGTNAPTLPHRIFTTAAPGVSFASRLIPEAVRSRALRAFLESRIRHAEALEWMIDEVGRHDPAAILEASQAILRFSSHEWIGEIDVPTAVVVTARDTLVPPERQRKLAEVIPGSTVHLVDGDHAACGYRPKEFAAALLDACSSVIRRATIAA